MRFLWTSSPQPRLAQSYQRAPRLARGYATLPRPADGDTGQRPARGGIIAGDFNAISPEDDGLVDKNELVRIARADPDGATWGVGVEWRDGLGPGRLDKVAMIGLKANEMEVLRPGPIEVPRPGEKPVEIPWSDHFGLK